MSNYKICVLMQGIPGSGKSFIADAIAQKINAKIHSTDNFFMENGKYKFDPNKLNEFHKKNLENTVSDMEKGLNVVVDNTNITNWQAEPYVKAAEFFGYMVQFVRVSGHNFGNTHNVPLETLKKMHRDMQDLSANKSPLYKKCNNPECKVSTHIGGDLSFGSGELDFHGFWEIPCPVCARSHEKAYPEDGECWPYKRDENAISKTL